jgi:hypothetical protein
MNFCRSRALLIYSSLSARVKLKIYFKKKKSAFLMSGNRLQKPIPKRGLSFRFNSN